MNEPRAARVLVVEDSPFLRHATRAVLTRRGYEVVEAADGEAALEVLRVEQPDLIVLDLVVPRVSGIDVLRVIRADPRHAKTPVIVMSVLDPSLAGPVIRSAVQGYFRKENISLTKLANHVESLLMPGERVA